ncbi:MAG TPA: 2Fe-2S iron-sulfur cluster-binding protein [Thermoanaerobaculia bacterium]|nr:2Fe-2S iron-sulfur cluster-binding protein [Thermoanaerobaculia bacterium]
MAKVTVDGKTVEVPNDANALEACRAAGVDVPHFCYHPRLSIVGQCRMCMVEVEGVPKIQASCTVPVRDGMVIKASTEKALAARNATMEFLLINHPLDCPICDQAGECKLQDNAVSAGLPVSRTSETRRQFPGYDRTPIGPHVITDMTRCIQCTRCIRFCAEITGTGELAFVERGGHTFVWTHEGRALDNDLSACAADVCPVGALTTRDFRFRKRVWWLDKTRSVCDGCEIGCNMSIEHRDRVVYRFLPRVQPAVNDFWMCDYGRFRSDDLNRQDFTKPEIRVPGGDAREDTNWGEALDAVKVAIDEALGEEREDLASKGREERVRFIGSAHLTTEEAWLLATLCKDSLKVNAPEFFVDDGPKRRIKNKADGWIYGTEAAPNSRGAEAAGLKRAKEGGTSPLSLLLSRKSSFSSSSSSLSSPAVLYVADADFSERCADPAFVAELRKASVLIVHARRRNALTDAADIVLPVAPLSGKEGTFVNAKGRVQRVDMAIVSPPIVRTDLEILLHLGARWGVFDTQWTARDVFERMQGSVAGYGGLAWDSDALVGNPPSISPAAAYDVLGLDRNPDVEVFPRPSVAAPDRLS